MRSLGRNFLEQQAIPLEFVGSLRALGEYRGKQELFSRQTPQILNTLKQVNMINGDTVSGRYNRDQSLSFLKDQIQNIKQSSKDLGVSPENLVRFAHNWNNGMLE